MLNKPLQVPEELRLRAVTVTRPEVTRPLSDRARIPIQHHLPWQPVALVSRQLLPFLLRGLGLGFGGSTLSGSLGHKVLQPLISAVHWDWATCYRFSYRDPTMIFFLPNRSPKNEFTTWAKVKTTFCVDISKGPGLFVLQWRSLVTITVYYTFFDFRKEGIWDVVAASYCKSG